MVYRIRTGPPFDMVEAKRLYKAGRTLKEVSEELGITYGLFHYWFVKKRRKRRALPRWQSSSRIARQKQIRTRNKQIRLLRLEGEKMNYLGGVFKLTQQQISRICKGVLPAYTHFTSVAARSKSDA